VSGGDEGELNSLNTLFITFCTRFSSLSICPTSPTKNIENYIFVRSRPYATVENRGYCCPRCCPNRDSFALLFEQKEKPEDREIAALDSVPHIILDKITSRHLIFSNPELMGGGGAFSNLFEIGVSAQEKPTHIVCKE
jgi:hypothetical protein